MWPESYLKFKTVYNWSVILHFPEIWFALSILYKNKTVHVTKSFSSASAELANVKFATTMRKGNSSTLLRNILVRKLVENTKTGLKLGNVSTFIHRTYTAARAHWSLICQLLYRLETHYIF